MTITTKRFANLQPGIGRADDLKVRQPVNEALNWLGEGLVDELNAHFASVSASIANAISVYDSTRPAFSAHKNGVNQTSISATPTKITFGTELFDEGSYFASSTYTPLSAGKYFLSAAVRFTAANAVDNEQVELHIYKNGASHKAQICPRAGTGFFQVDVDALVDANGTTDAFEVYATKNGAGAGDVQGVAELTYFQGFKI